MINVTLPQVTRALRDIGVEVSAAEAHGWLCGALCSSQPLTLASWFEELVPDLAASASAAAAQRDGPLQVLYADTSRALQGDDLEFAPLLPDDDVALARRAECLSQWCQGFLYGLGTHKLSGQRRLSAEVEEVVKDFTEIGRATAQESDDGEDEEQAYAELVEFVRVGVQLVHDEITHEPDSARGYAH